jgi:hypothetical protein
VAEYDVAHLRRSLAEELGELGIQVEATSDRLVHRLVLSGAVESTERRDEVCRRAREVCPEHQIVDAMTVVATGPPSDVEEVP